MMMTKGVWPGLKATMGVAVVAARARQMVAPIAVQLGKRDSLQLSVS